ncbi:MAG TPA: response regulator [Pirellulales bacterium]|jgi:CheY-like chemotaxis protein|nr:response regulator [Pirellulales bacterium]
MITDSLVIVLAEDDPGHAQLVQRNLQRAGIANEIVHVSDGQEALDYVHRQGSYQQRLAKPILLLLDINMPRVDGVEVLRQVKQHELLAKIPIIMLTTTDDPREIDRCYELGCNVYITKPVEYEALVEAIRRLGLLLQIVKLPAEAQK